MRILLLIFLTLTLTQAAQAPNRKSLRALSMGNAFVAVAEDRQAIYYNPAGLNLIDKLGNYEEHPHLGYYPNNYLDMNIDFGINIFDGFGKISDANQFIKDHRETFKGSQNDVLNQVSEDSTLYNDFIGLGIDRQPIELGSYAAGEFAFHNFGGALWADVVARPYLDAGIITPRMGMDEAMGVLVGQLAFGMELNREWSIGAGYRLVYSQTLGQLEFGMNDLDIVADSIKNILDAEQDSLVSSTAFSHAIDLGAMYQFSREVRFGAALQNIFLGNFHGRSVTPELTLGVGFSPRKWQRNTAYARKVNFAFDMEDMLNNDRNYKFFSKLNFGVEIDQVLLAWPSLGWAGNLRVLRGRVATGFKGGYWTAGAGIELFRLIHIDIATWAEEGGYFTGQEEQRSLVLQIGGGF